MTWILRTSGVLTAATGLSALVLFAAALMATARSGAQFLRASTLSQVKGWSTDYKAITGNVYCACVATQVNPGAGFVCDCVGNVGQPCLECNGRAYASGEYSPGYSGWQPSGGSGNCNAMGLFSGTCALDANNNPECQNAILPLGPCSGTYPLFQDQGVSPADLATPASSSRG